MSSKHNREILILVAAILVVGILIPFVTHFELRWETNRYISRLKASGEPMDLTQVLPPPVPAQRDTADTLAEAFGLISADHGLFETNYYGTEMMRMVAPGKAIVCWREPADNEFVVTNSWQDLATAVAQNQMTFALLRQTIDKPVADFGIHYSLGEADLGYKNLHFSESKRAAQQLSTALMCDLRNGDTTLAVENLRAMLALAGAMESQRLMISELFSIAIAQIAVTANWEVLQSSNLTDRNLAQLQADWAKVDFVQGYKNMLEMQRAIGEIMIKKWRISTSEWISPSDGFGEYAKSASQMILWRGWWSYSDETRGLQGYEVMIQATRLEQTNNSFLAAIRYQERNLDGLTITNLDDTDYHWVFTTGMSSLGPVLKRVMAAETAKRIVITAIALKRYHLKHGEYPATLDALVPGCLSAVPLDPVDGKLLRYRLNADGTFLLYSVGLNGVDDGGNPALEKGTGGANMSWLNYHALDWVWPRPVSGAGTNGGVSP